MKKSPLSTPRGNGGRQGFGWKSRESYSGTGYGCPRNNNYERYSTDSSGNNDFIPLGLSTPVKPESRNSGNWSGPGSGHGYWNSGGSGYHRNNSFQNNSRAAFRNSPYRHRNKKHQGPRNILNEQNDIMQYVDLASFLEDPWADLIKTVPGTEINMEMHKFSKKEGKIYNAVSENQNWVGGRQENENESLGNSDSLCESTPLESRFSQLADVKVELGEKALDSFAQGKEEVSAPLKKQSHSI
ncbi:uncharacterized protein LOC105703802 [Orussus abietinus]|uniref:uncharacterized protein LOC105703802 n=1 Tax=Orussus abietinus TaxID=222816 RepID=UPI0006262B0C|nr:uncharacterized protein LOC105703802 [Orussus abietinus]